MQLNMEQRKLIQSKPSGHSMIKGVAGSGKTTVSVYRIPFLIYNYCMEKDDTVLMVTFNRTLLNYIKYLYEKVEEEDKIEFQSIFGGDKTKVDIYTVDKLMHEYFIEYKKKYKYPYNINSEKKHDLFNLCIAELKKSFDVPILEQKYSTFLYDEIDWIKCCNYMELEEYQNADRLGRTNKQGGDGPQKLLKNSKTRRAIFELMLLYNEKLKKEGLIEFRDASILALNYAKEHVTKKYTHIIIDESQDLTRVQLEFLNLLYLQKPHSSITFVCDTAQSIYPRSWLVKGRSFTSIGFDMTGRSHSLSKNYRTTTQVAEAAYSLIENDADVVEDENFVKPSLIDRQGLYPVYRCLKTPQEESEYVINEIKENLTPAYSYKDIVVIAKNKSQLNNIKEYFEKEKIPCMLMDSKKELNFEEESVKLLTMHSIKGLEFKVVFIIGLNQGIIPYLTYQDEEDQQMQETTDRKLLYVGMTRANELLYMTSSGIPSKFISEINPKLLRLSCRNRFRRYYSMLLDEYAYKDEIHNIYSNEEKIRQWMIKELETNYKYPLKLMNVEYRVNNFSKVGAVDIAVCIYRNNTRIPYVFVEIKAQGKGIANGIEQLKSYMSNSATCQYGIVTDGNELVIINKDFEVVDDIPMFDPRMLPSTLETYNYMDLRYNKSFVVSMDTESKDEIEVEYGGERMEYCGEALKGLSIYSSIAAGQLTYMGGEMTGEFFLPREWFAGKDESFILKVRGDSMQGAGIDDGDYVVIQRQQSAQNRDIVAVAIDEDATLKRFTRMGDTVLLIPENERYEPIQIGSEQARIIGIAVGVLKRKCG